MRPMPSAYSEVFRSPRVAAVLVLGFASGLPLALTGSTLQAWLTVSGVDIRTIAWFSWIGVPYLLKFLWAPVMDRFVPPFLGRRRGWMLLFQLALLSGIAAMALAPPNESILLLGIVALWVAFASASQDIVIDAYRTDVLQVHERGMGAAVGVFGYRIAMLASGGLALILADQFGWRFAYLLMAALMGIGLIASVLAPEPQAPAAPPRSLLDAVVQPLADLFSRRGAFALLALVMLYKFGDALAGTLTTAFLIRGVGFTPTDVGVVNKFLGLAALLLGALAGGVVLARLSLFRALLAFGALQAVSNLSFAWLAWAGKSYPLLVFAVAFENLASGMGTAAFVALAMALCNTSFSATQYALLSALASLGRVLFGPATGALVAWMGWAEFFIVTFVAALPGLWLVWRMREQIGAAESARA
ncbi:MAG: muropeptide transporter AmpG [Betaproteobacteria bacterium RIFCSPLOWO2_12_FULL_63_13]|nr:MAG: muropeptide transporter AmpG [Betaproteobacteria bacterium RIFCSPLOWO2_12_FULL_63_13]